MVSFKDLDIPVEEKCRTIKINDTTNLEVRPYLPIQEKTDFLNYIVSSSLDENTGCFSPLRVNVYFSIAICKWYGGIDIGDEDVNHVYDTLESQGVVGLVLSAIPEEEKEFITELVEDTVDDISRYNSSAAGIINNMSFSAEELDERMRSLLAQFKDKDSLQILKAMEAEVKKG